MYHCSTINEYSFYLQPSVFSFYWAFNRNAVTKSKNTVSTPKPEPINIISEFLPVKIYFSRDNPIALIFFFSSRICYKRFYVILAYEEKKKRQKRGKYANASRLGQTDTYLEH